MDLLYKSDNSDEKQNGCINILKDLQKTPLSALGFVTKDFKPPKYVHCEARHPEKIWKAALKSDRVQWVIRQIVREEGKDEADVVKEAGLILKELAYTDHMSVVRMFGYALYKIMSRIYHDGVYVNIENIDEVRSVMKNHPVVFMPSHRSYVDFLMLSFVCFYVDLPLPAIASAMDFMGMKLVGSALRACGAFYMRRSFGSDRLYWALFTEYVHTILINGDRPLEFFIEGTRSRTGKSLNPKFGLLSVIAEPYLKAQTYDALLVPISISYDRLLEETLYAYEMLGIPKPKESTSGLMKGLSILNNNYGSVHVNFGKPVSLRDYFGHLDRAVHACYPRYMLRLSSTEQKYMEILGYKILLEQQKGSVHSPWSLVALILSQHPNGISLDKLLDEMHWIKQVLMKCNINMSWPVGTVRECVMLHLHRFKHVVELRDDVSPGGTDTVVWIAGGHNRQQARSETKLTGLLNPSIIEETVNHIMVASYRNQVLHNFIRPALVAFACTKTSVNDCSQFIFSKEQCIKEFKFLRHLLSKEFIFEPMQIDGDFEQGVRFLMQSDSIVAVGNQQYRVRNDADKMLQFLKSTFSVFFVTYWMACQYLLSSDSSHVMNKSYAQVKVNQSKYALL